MWAGDQLLWELRVPGGNTLTGSALDATDVAGAMYGRVSYFHAGGIDRPLLITKEGAESVVPRETWRGQFHAGTSPVTGASRNCPIGVQTNCLLVDWPGMRTNAQHGWAGEQPDIDVWYGGLVDGMRDASGQMYMRNRYYDPATGQFTQTDPIGIAGGMNVYGFAAGDPVSYSDPYGLKPNGVFVLCRPVGGEGGEGIGGHCAIRVVDKRREIDVTIELLNVNWKNEIVSSLPGSRRAEAYLEPINANLVSVPEGMTSEEFDDAVLAASVVEGSKITGDSYLPFGDVNSNRYVYNVIRAAGGKVPRFSSEGFLSVPGICGGRMLSRGKDCAP